MRKRHFAFQLVVRSYIAAGILLTTTDRWLARRKIW